MTDLATILSQFGAAGLMGLLWILERRHAAIRERQLGEAHRHLAAGQHELGVLLQTLRDNTRAIVALEHTQRHLLRLAERLDHTIDQRLGRRSADARPHAGHAGAA